MRVLVTRLAAAAAGIASFAMAGSAAAALAVSAAAPAFSAPGAQGGRPVTIELRSLLARGPVVLFFFPSAFTETGECGEFAASIAAFNNAGVSVVGASRDATDTLIRFSAKECGGVIPILSAEEAVVNAYEVNDGAMFNTRTTYVISRSGKVAFVLDDDDSAKHVKWALKIVENAKPVFVP